MKARIFFFALALSGISTLAVAQPTDQPSLVVKVNPLALFGRNQFYFEAPVSRHGSVEVSLAQFNSLAGLSISMDNVFAEQRDLSHWMVIPSYRFYFSGEAPRGTYFGLYGRGKFSSGPVKVEVDDDVTIGHNYDHYRSVTELGAGFVLGRQWITKKNMVYDLFLGSGSSYRWINNDYDDPNMTDRIYEHDVLGDQTTLDRWLHQLRFGFVIGFQLGGR